MSSALAPRTDIDLARPKKLVARIECYGTLTCPDNPLSLPRRIEGCSQKHWRKRAQISLAAERVIPPEDTTMQAIENAHCANVDTQAPNACACADCE